MNHLPPFTPFAPLAGDADAALEEIFGFPAFREGQREVIDTVLSGQDTVVVMPTGSGKSLCYMLPACVIEGLVVVVSPLIALMKDQTEALEEFGIPATCIHSGLSLPEQEERLTALRLGVYKVVLVAPERFKSGRFTRAIEGLPVGLFAIDEAHCISSWGHDFRPDYLVLDEVRRQLGEPTTMALTATATPAVQRDIAAQLELEDPKIVVSGFRRPNLFFEVAQTRSEQEKFDRIQAALGQVDDGSALVYCATRKQVEKVCRRLEQAGLHPLPYHGGLPDARRDEVQDAFMASDAPLLVATNAFGMGVDKSDVRLIAHFNIPGSVEAYYQEAGRAGRDGEPATCMLLFNYADRGIHDFFTENSYPDQSVVLRLWKTLSQYGVGTHPLDADMLADFLSRGGGGRVHSWAVQSALRLLERGGHVDSGLRDGRPWLAVLDLSRDRDLRIDFDELDRRRKIATDHLRDVIRYAQTAECRQVFLIRYFSDRGATIEECGYCDRCQGPLVFDELLDAPVLIRDEPQLLVRKLLSGVARTRGRWGTHVVAGMLRGSRAKKILQSSLSNLSTYGLLSEYRQADLVRLLDVLGQAGLTEQNRHGALLLTAQGKEVMVSDDPLPRAVEALFSRHVTTTPGAARRAAATTKKRATRSATGPLADTYLRTLQMVRDGLDYKAIAERRGLTTGSVLRHFLVLAGQGHDLGIDAHRDGAILPELREIAADWTPGDPLKPLKEELTAICDYDELKLNLAILLSERNKEETGDVVMGSA